MAITNLAVPTKEFFVPPTFPAAASYGDYAQVNCSAVGSNAYTTFHVPEDFLAIIDAVLVVIPTDTIGNANWDIFSDYAAVGEQFNINSEQDQVTTYNVTNVLIFEIDLSGILTALAAGDNVGIQFSNPPGVAQTLRVLGVRFRYR